MEVDILDFMWNDTHKDLEYMNEQSQESIVEVGEKENKMVRCKYES